MTPEDLDNRFTYHAPKSHEQADKYVRIRQAGRNLAGIMDECAPDSRELSLAITHLEQAVMWANAAIARNDAG